MTDEQAPLALGAGVEEIRQLEQQALQFISDSRSGEGRSQVMCPEEIRRADPHRAQTDIQEK